MISTLMPSYGKDFKSKAGVIEALNNGKDFTESLSGSQISSSELLKMNVFSVSIRYAKLRKVLVCEYNQSKGVWI